MIYKIKSKDLKGKKIYVEEPNDIIDFSNPNLKYKDKNWLIEEMKMEKNKGKIRILKSAVGGSYPEIKNKKLFFDGFEVKKRKMGGSMTEKWTEFRYGKYGENTLNKEYVAYLEKYMKPFKIEWEKK